jgi:cytochrome P450
LPEERFWCLLNSHAFDVFSAAFRVDPYPTYAYFRLHDPLHYGRPPTPGEHQSGWWYAFAYTDVAAILKDPRFGRDVGRAIDGPLPPIPSAEREPFWEMFQRWTLTLEPPQHTRQRGLLNQAFTARVVEALRPSINTMVNSLLDELAQRPQIDVVADFAFPLTLTVINQLIGIPPADNERIKQWSLTIAAVLDYKSTWEIMARGNKMTLDFQHYLRKIVAARRGEPRNDLISRLLRVETAGAPLVEEELIALCVMLLFAGHETTVNLIAAGMYLLLTHPEQLALLHQQPQLMDSALNEVLRLHSPIQATSRTAYADVELGEKVIRRGEAITLLLGSANRDAAVFSDPEQMDIGRRPNRHLAFGRGIHYCLGATLAVAQAGIALSGLISRFPHLRLVSETPRWSETFGFRGLQELAVNLYP